MLPTPETASWRWSCHDVVVQMRWACGCAVAARTDMPPDFGGLHVTPLGRWQVAVAQWCRAHDDAMARYLASKRVWPRVHAPTPRSWWRTMLSRRGAP